MEERIGHVDYRLQLPAEARIHNVFHVSQLKKKIGNQVVTVILPEFMNDVKEFRRKPIAILDRQLVKRLGKEGAKVLVQWSDSSPDEATWEFYDTLQKKFPEFCSTNP